MDSHLFNSFVLKIFEKCFYPIQMILCPGLKTPRKTANIPPEYRIVDTVAEDCPGINVLCY